MASGPIAGSPKAATAFRTIGELSSETGIAQHILRYWETRFPELRPLQRAGNRRYYRPEDVTLVHRIDRLLNREGYTVRGVQQLLKQGPVPSTLVARPQTASTAAPHPAALWQIRTMLAEALAIDT